MLNGMVVVPNWGFPPLETLPPLKNVIQWTALHVFRIAEPLVITGSGSGDKTANWVAAFCLIVASGLGTILWSALDRKRVAYPSLDRWFRLPRRLPWSLRTAPTPARRRRSTRGGVERSPLVTDYDRWRRLVIQNATTIYLQRMDETFLSYPAKYDEIGNTLALTKAADKNWKATLAVQRRDPTHLTFTGTIDGCAIEMRTSLVDRAKFLLFSRGFNWVQEFPFNR